MTKHQIEIIQDQIEALIGEPIDHTNPTAVTERLSGIATMLSTGAKCIAESKRALLLKRREWLRTHMEKLAAMKPSVAKEFVETACVDEEIAFVRCDRNYSALVHAGDFMRSILSQLKAEMQFSHAA